MTKKHFESIANSVRVEVERCRRNGDADGFWAIARVASNFCAEFKRFNAGFKRDRFLVACGFEKGQNEVT